MATTSQSARDLALALTSAMNGARGPDSKLRHTIKRLAEAAGLEQSSPSDLENDPVIKRARAEVATTQQEIKGHSDQLQTIQTSTTTAPNDVRALRNMMEGMFSGGPDQWSSK
eukprot:8912843-Pyramimonas_sp.AAC.1